MPGKGKPFEKGNKFAHGQPPLPDDVKRARKINQVEFERIINKYLYMDLVEIDGALKKDGVPIIELLIASVIQKALHDGDERRLGFLMDRLLGRVPMKIAIPQTGPEQPRLVREVSGLSDDEVKLEIMRLERGET